MIFSLKPLLTFSNEIGKSVEDSTINILLKVFELICIVFGKDFTRKIIRPMFEVEVSAIEQKLAKLQTNNVSFVTVSVYLGAVLSTLQDDNQNISAILKK